MASFDGNGLVIDRLADIKTEIQEALRSVYGDGVNLEETSPWGVIIGVVSERYYLLYELLEAVYNASFPNTAFGVYLDELVAFNGITRDSATSSTVVLTFTRSNGLNDGDVTIPQGTQVTDPNSSTVIWLTDTIGTILDGQASALVGATANQTGPLGALIGSLTNMIAIPTNVASVINNVDAIEGRNEETDAELKRRRETQLGRSGTATEPGIRSALINLAEVLTATLILNDTDATDGDGRPPHSFQSYVALEAGFQLGQISTLTADAPLVASNSIALTIDALPIAGSPVAFNTDNDTTMLDIAAAFQAEASVGKATSDGTIITLNGATEAAYTATAVVTGGASQAVFTFDAGLPSDGTIDIIAQALWDAKGAGIQTVGDFQGEATDSVGDTKFLNFSDIEQTPVYVRYTLETDLDYVQASSEEAIAAAANAYAVANLLPGVDVLNYKLLCAASDVNALGITGIIVDFSTVGTSGPWDPANIVIEPFEFATIDIANVVFLYVPPLP